MAPFIGLLNTIVMSGRLARGPCVLEQYGPAKLERNGTARKGKNNPGTAALWARPAVFHIASANHTATLNAFSENAFPYAQVGTSYSYSCG